MKESRIVTAIKTYLQMHENQGRLVYIRNNSGAYKIGNRFIRFGKPGSPDFVVFIDHRNCIHIEVKNETGRQSELQLEYQKKVENLEHFYVIVKSLDDLESVFRDMKII